ncbi:hypothetical protein PFISCL1PPCAC_5284 [Pristionchus fissidentatus]|uniref:Serpentine receptor class gamma n=1 Tax=Pristionchus fissidentatus TaxID=1538716 RepID=A0AAV5V327_9BILA|nr:hypothetical protein PFISCL1PPCAC_5284 [Pristionchus fissidentatus]
MYLVNFVAVQFTNWPSFAWFYGWLRISPLSLVLRFLQDFSKSVMWQTTFFISLNRFLSLKCQFLLTKVGYYRFTASLKFRKTMSALISIPLFFSHYEYTEACLYFIFDLFISENV